MSKDLSTKKQNAVDPDKGLPGPLEQLFDAQCDNSQCGRGFSMEAQTHYEIVGPTGLILRVYCSAKCLATVVDPEMVRRMAFEVEQKLSRFDKNARVD